MKNIDLDIQLFEKLSNLFGPSGFEHEIQKLVKQIGEKYADEVSFDKTGSVIFKYGHSGPKIMLAAHSDEVGFIVSKIEDNGFLRLLPLGSWWDQVLLGQQLRIRPLSGQPDLIGILGAKPPHVLKAKERKKLVTFDEMFVDIGCQSAKDVKHLGIEIGDPAVPEATFRIEKRTFFRKNDENKEEEKTLQLAIGKAFDDRLGVFVALEFLKYLKTNDINPPNQLYIVATTQEEVNLRGARTAARMIQPDIGIVLESGIAADVPGITKFTAKLGGGILIDFFDASMIANPFFRIYLTKLCRELNFDYNLFGGLGAGTDGGVIHLTGDGAPTICLAPAVRHIHSHYGIVAMEDLTQLTILLLEAIQRLDENTVKGFTQI
ncbi:putative aminopeptidase YsdC [subsurface metagenome]